MNRLKILPLILTTVFLCSGCIIASINPFYTKDVLVAIPEFAGNWDLIKNGDEDYKPGEIKSWQIDEDEILTFDKKGRGGPFTYKTFKVADEILLDIIPTSNSSLDASDFWVMSVWPVHLLLKLTIEDDQITLTPLNYEWFEQKMKSKELTLPMITPTDEQWGVYNVKPKEWAAFLMKYKNEKDFFREESKIVLKRKKAL